ncbi:unnamed protein product, partial [Adineta ricciae]
KFVTGYLMKTDSLQTDGVTAQKKSPFDPCPQGWRVPDTFYASMHATLPKLSNFYSYWALSSGNNPWYYNGYQASGAG